MTGFYRKWRLHSLWEGVIEMGESDVTWRQPLEFSRSLVPRANNKVPEEHVVSLHFIHSVMDYSIGRICRICLKEGDDLRSIFYSEDVPTEHVSLSIKIMACSSVQVRMCLLYITRRYLRLSVKFSNIFQRGNLVLVPKKRTIYIHGVGNV